MLGMRLGIGLDIYSLSRLHSLNYLEQVARQLDTTSVMGRRLSHAIELMKSVEDDLRDLRYEDAARIQINAFKGGLQLYYNHFGRYPQNLEDLRERPGGADAERWKGPYLEENIPQDPWGRPYQYELGDDGYGGETYIITSMGADGQPGTDDDVSNRPKG